MFDNLENMAKFAQSLLDKPFALSLGKIFGEPSLFAYIYLPLAEFRRFVDSLGELVRTGFLRRYDYAFQDMDMTQRYSIPYRNFKNKSWLYDQEKYLNKVHDLIETEMLSDKEKKRQVAAPYV